MKSVEESYLLFCFAGVGKRPVLTGLFDLKGIGIPLFPRKLI